MSAIFNITVPEEYVKLCNELLMMFTIITVAYLAHVSIRQNEKQGIEEIVLYILIGFLYYELFMKYMIQFSSN